MNAPLPRILCGNCLLSVEDLQFYTRKFDKEELKHLLMSVHKYVSKPGYKYKCSHCDWFFSLAFLTMQGDGEEDEGKAKPTFISKKGGDFKKVVIPRRMLVMRQIKKYNSMNKKGGGNLTAKEKRGRMRQYNSFTAQQVNKKI